MLKLNENCSELCSVHAVGLDVALDDVLLRDHVDGGAAFGAVQQKMDLDAFLVNRDAEKRWEREELKPLELIEGLLNLSRHVLDGKLDMVADTAHLESISASQSTACKGQRATDAMLSFCMRRSCLWHCGQHESSAARDNGAVG